MKKIIILFSLMFLMQNIFAIVSEEYSVVDIHGFISQGYLISDHNNIITNTEDGTFKFNEVGLNFSTSLTENLRFGVQLLSRDLDNNENKINLDWGYGDYRWRDWLGLRAGIMKVGYGLYNEIRDNDALKTNIFLPQSIYNEGWRESVSSIEGVSLYGNLPLAMMGSLEYQLQTGLIKITEDGRMAKSISLSLLNIEDIDEKQSNITKLTWQTPIDLSLAFTWIDLDFDVTATNTYQNPVDGSYITEDVNPAWDTEVYTFSGEYNWENLTLAAEYTLYDYNMEFDIYNGAVSVEPFEAEGYYGSLAYRFTDWFKVGTYYSEYYFDKDDKDGDQFAPYEERGRLKDFTLTTRFDINTYWSFKLENHAMFGVAQTFPDENMDEEGNIDYEEKWNLFAAKLTYFF